MRRLLRSFADAGGTVLLSSHQLREVQATVDRLVVIAAGRLVREGMLDELTSEAGTRVGAEDPAALRAALDRQDRKSTRLNSSHVALSSAVFCFETTPLLA